MQITFEGQKLDVRSLDVKPGRLRIGDILLGPNGMLLKTVTVQKGCPVWESNVRTENHYIFETEDHQLIPVRKLSESVHIFRINRRR